MALDRDVLSDEVKPINYAISLTDLKAGEPWTYQGKVDIELEVKKTTKSITLNTFELKVHSADFVSDSGKHSSAVKASNISFDKKNQRCTFSFDQELLQSPKSVLSIAFEGVMNNHMAGFYRYVSQLIQLPAQLAADIRLEWFADFIPDQSISLLWKQQRAWPEMQRIIICFRHSSSPVTLVAPFPASMSRISRLHSTSISRSRMT